MQEDYETAYKSIKMYRYNNLNYDISMEREIILKLGRISYIVQICRNLCKFHIPMYKEIIIRLVRNTVWF